MRDKQAQVSSSFTDQMMFLAVDDVEMRVHDKITRYGLEDAVTHFTEDERNYFDLHVASVLGYDDVT